MDRLISERAVLDTIADFIKNNDSVAKLILNINAIPSAEPKTGHWSRVTDKTGHLVWECDKCGWQQRFNTNFCPNCGARMVEPQESEDKE